MPPSFHILLIVVCCKNPAAYVSSAFTIPRSLMISEKSRTCAIYTDSQKKDYIELALDDDRLIGKKEGNIVMHCEFVKGPDGQFKLKNGDVDIYGPDGQTIIRQESIRDFKLVKVLHYGPDGQLYEAIVTINGDSIQFDNQGRVLHGKRFNFIDNVITDYKNGSVTKIEIQQVYAPSELERQEYIGKGYTDEDLKNFEIVYIYDASDVAHKVKVNIKDGNGKLIESTLLNNKAKSIWEHAVKIATNSEAATYITLDKDKGVANVDMELTYPEIPTNRDDVLEILGPAYDLARYIAGNHADWHMAIVNAIPEVGALVANGDAKFVYIAGINDTGKSTTELEHMKNSLQTNKTVVVGHSAGTETAIRSAFCAKADKYIIASPRMTPEKFCAIMQESGVRPDQVIIVSTKGDFYNWGWTYEDSAPSHWTSIYIENGPGVSIISPRESHSVPIDGWLSGGTYTVRVNGSGPINTTLASIYSVKVNED